MLCVDERRVTDRAEAAELDERVRAAAPAFDDGRGTGAASLRVMRRMSRDCSTTCRSRRLM
jgi:hypothetical protein